MNNLSNSSSEIEIYDEELKEYMYYNLVKGEKDFIGMIAYCLYKNDKIKFIKDYKNTNNQNDPSMETLHQYQKSLCLPEEICKYNEKAKNLMATTCNYILQDRVKRLKSLELELNEKESEIDKENRKLEIKSNKLIQREKELNKRDKYCKAVKPNGFLYGVGQSVVASGFMIALTVIIFLFSTLPSDIGSYLIERIKSNQIESTQVNSNPNIQSTVRK